MDTPDPPDPQLLSFARNLLEPGVGSRHLNPQQLEDVRRIVVQMEAGVPPDATQRLFLGEVAQEINRYYFGSEVTEPPAYEGWQYWKPPIGHEDPDNEAYEDDVG